jgi:uncharacterized glyoxalase superfamily protein PhnB
MNSQVTLVVNNLSDAVDFYRKAFGFSVVSERGKSAVLTYKTMDFHFCTEDYMHRQNHYMIESPAVSGMHPPVVFTLRTEQLHDQLSRAVAAGARVVRPLRMDDQGRHSALLQGPERYYWLLTDA